jgi:hypothetical protein
VVVPDDNLHSNLQQPCKRTESAGRSHFLQRAVFFFARLLFLGWWFRTSPMVTMAQLGVNVRKLNSNMRASLVNPSSTRGKNINGFDKNRKGMVGESKNLPSSPRFSSPMSSHAIARLRDLESEEDEEDESETANQQML